MVTRVLAAASLLGLGLLLALGPIPALAGDRLLKGPPPAWVKPYEVKAPPLDDKDAGAQPVRVLLQDRQLRFGPEGDTEYVEQVAQVRNPQGLTAAGTVQMGWDPDRDTLTVHRLTIRRDGREIDVLARQEFTILRREANLERQVIDGQLTATLQPEGLQVGDVIDFAYSITHVDPVLQGRTDRASLFPFGPVDRLRLRATWDPKIPLQWRVGEGLETPKVGRSGGLMELTLDMKNPPPPKFPAGAPLRFVPLRELQASGFRSWSEVSTLLAPVFAQAATIAPDSPLRGELERIRAASKDPKVRASLALALVEDKIRYLAVTLNLGGYVPQPADRTWELRYGDCKAKTALLMALLHELGIEAEAAVVNATPSSDLVPARLPSMAAFNHVIVRATIRGKVYWLDGTRTGDTNIEVLRPPPFQWALPLRASGAELMAIEEPPLTEPDTAMRLTVDASGGLDAPAKVRGEIVLSGRPAAAVQAATGLPADDRDKLLKSIWALYPWIEVKSVAASTDPARGVATVQMEGSGRPPFERGPNGRSFRIRAGEVGGSRSSYERDAGTPHADAPFLVEGYPSYYAFTLVMTLPGGGQGFSFDAPDVDTVVAGRAFTRKSRIDGATAKLEVTRRTVAREITAAEAAKAKTAMEELAKVHVALRAPDRYIATSQDLAAMKAATPTTSAGFIDRGDQYMARGMDKEAMADFDKAVELDPNSAFAYANRALGHFFGGRLPEAKADIAKAQQLDPRNYVALHAVGQVAMREGRYADAAAAFGRAADLKADNVFALRAQAGAYRALGDTDKALAAVAELERVAPATADLAQLRYLIYLQSGDREKALELVEAALKKTPDDAQLHLFRGGLLAAAGRDAEADAALDRSISLKPSPEAYLTRASRRPAAQVDARLADIDAAEKLAPGNARIAARRAAALAEAGRFDAALEALKTPIKAKPDDDELLYARADVFVRAGKADLAARDFATLRGRAGSADQLNALCWQQAIRGFALTTALADCEAALKAQPGHADALDSRAFVLMRLGRLPEALAAYDAAIKARPKQAESLFGRGLTRQGLAQTAEAAADFAAARAVDATIDRTFSDYGLKPPPGGVVRPTTTASAQSMVDQRQP